jgi:uncharacterized glyoxalase superfamily protein PhnB
MRTVTAMLAVDGAAEAIDLYARAFGAVELPGRAPDPSGKKIWHAEIRIGDSIVFVNDASPEMGNPARPSALWLCVEDCDAFYARAVAAGLKSEMPPMDMFWGDRHARVSDKFGNAWAIATRVEDLTPEEMKVKEAAFIASMKR